MNNGRWRAPKVGERLTPELTVLGIIDRHRDHSLCIVWNDDAWCPMACKILRSPGAAAREAAILSQVSHPNIVRSFGCVAPGLLLLEFLDGFPLDILLRKKPAKRLSVSDALRVAMHIGAGLEHIHRRGLLHMDVKPSNIMVTRSGRPVLFDLGSARSQQGVRPPFVEGTDDYMAPEECVRGEITPKADTFGLGVTLYEMLTGKLPFPARKKGHPYPQTCCPPQRIRAHRQKIPCKLDELVLSCLSASPDGRPAIAKLLPELHAFITSGPPMWPKDFAPNAN